MRLVRLKDRERDNKREKQMEIEKERESDGFTASMSAAFKRMRWSV